MALEKKFVFESMQDCSTIGGFLKAITEGIEKGELQFVSPEEKIEMQPSGLLFFTVKARKKGNENKIGIKITWKEKRMQGNAGSLSIGS